MDRIDKLIQRAKQLNGGQLIAVMADGSQQRMSASAAVRYIFGDNPPAERVIDENGDNPKITQLLNACADVFREEAEADAEDRPID